MADTKSVDDIFSKTISEGDEEFLFNTLVTKLNHLTTSDPYCPPTTIVKQVELLHEKKPSLFQNESIEGLLKQFLITSQIKNNKRASAKGPPLLIISIIKIIMGNNMMTNETSLISLFRLYLEDSLGSRIWVDEESQSVKAFCGQLLSMMHPFSENDASKPLREECERIILEILPSRLSAAGILLSSSLNATNIQNGVVVTTSSWASIKTITCLLGLSSIRTLASQCLEKWLTSFSISDELNVLIQTLANHISSRAESDGKLIDSDSKIIEELTSLRTKMKASHMEAYKQLMITIPSRAPFTAAILIKILVWNDIFGGNIAIPTANTTPTNLLNYENVKADTLKLIVSMITPFRYRRTYPFSHTSVMDSQTAPNSSVTQSPKFSPKNRTQSQLQHQSAFFQSTVSTSSGDSSRSWRPEDKIEAAEAVGQAMSMVVDAAQKDMRQHSSIHLSRVLLDFLIRFLRARSQFMVADIPTLFRVLLGVDYPLLESSYNQTQTGPLQDSHSGGRNNSILSEIITSDRKLETERDRLRLFSDLVLYTQLLVTHEIVTLEKEVKERAALGWFVSGTRTIPATDSSQREGDVSSAEGITAATPVPVPAPKTTTASPSLPHSLSKGRGGGGRLQSSGKGGAASSGSSMFRGTNQSTLNPGRGRVGLSLSNSSVGPSTSTKKLSTDTTLNRDPSASNSEESTKAGVSTMSLVDEGKRIRALRRTIVDSQELVLIFVNNLLTSHQSDAHKTTSLFEFETSSYSKDKGVNVSSSSGTPTYLWIEWLERVLSLQSISINKVPVDIENLAPFKCRDEGLVSSKLLHQISDFVLLCGGSQAEYEAGIDIVESVVERALSTQDLTGDNGVLVDDVTSVYQLFRLCRLVLREPLQTERSSSNKGEKFRALVSKPISFHELVGAREGVTAPDLTQGPSNPSSQKTLIEPDRAKGSVLSGLPPVPLYSSRPRAASIDTTASDASRTDTVVTASEDKMSVVGGSSVGGGSDDESDTGSEISRMNVSETYEDGEIEFESSTVSSRHSRSTLPSPKHREISTATTTMSPPMKRVRGPKSLESAEESQADKGAFAPVKSRLELIVPTLALRPLYWKICKICFALGCARPLDVGTVLWDSIPAIRLLMMMAISGRFLPPTPVESASRSLAGGYSRIVKSNLEKSFPLQLPDLPLFLRKIRLLSGNASSASYASSCIISNYGLELEQGSSDVLETRAREVEEMVWKELFSESFSLSQEKTKKIEKSLPKKVKTNKKEIDYKFTSVSRSGRVRKMKFDILSLNKRSSYQSSDEDASEEEDDDNDDDADYLYKSNTNYKKSIHVDKESLLPVLETQFGNQPVTADLMVLAVFNTPRAPPLDVIEAIKCLDKKFLFGDKLRKCENPDFIVRAILGDSTSTSSTVSRELMEESSAWLVPSIAVDVANILKRIPDEASLHLCLMAALAIYHKLQKYFVWNPEFNQELLTLFTVPDEPPQDVQQITSDTIILFKTGRDLAKVLCDSNECRADIKLWMVFLNKLLQRILPLFTLNEDISSLKELDSGRLIVETLLGEAVHTERGRRHAARLTMAVIALAIELHSGDPIHNERTAGDIRESVKEDVLTRVILEGPIDCDFCGFYQRCLSSPVFSEALFSSIRNMNVFRVEENINFIDKYLQYVIQNESLLSNIHEKSTTSENSISLTSRQHSPNISTKYGCKFTLRGFLALVTSQPALAVIFLEESYAGELSSAGSELMNCILASLESGRDIYNLDVFSSSETPSDPTHSSTNNTGSSDSYNYIRLTPPSSLRGDGDSKFFAIEAVKAVVILTILVVDYHGHLSLGEDSEVSSLRDRVKQTRLEIISKQLESLRILAIFEKIIGSVGSDDDIEVLFSDIYELFRELNILKDALHCETILTFVKSLPYQVFFSIYFNPKLSYTSQSFLFAIQSLDIKLGDGTDYEFSLALDSGHITEKMFLDVCKKVIKNDREILEDLQQCSAFLVSKLHMASYEGLNDSEENSKPTIKTDEIAMEISNVSVQAHSSKNDAISVTVPSGLESNSDWRGLHLSIVHRHLSQATTIAERILNDSLASLKSIDEKVEENVDKNRRLELEKAIIANNVQSILSKLQEDSVDMEIENFAVDILLYILSPLNMSENILQLALNRPEVSLNCRIRILLQIISLNPLQDLKALEYAIEIKPISHENVSLFLVLILPILRKINQKFSINAQGLGRLSEEEGDPKKSIHKDRKKVNFETRKKHFSSEQRFLGLLSEKDLISEVVRVIPFLIRVFMTVEGMNEIQLESVGIPKFAKSILLPGSLEPMSRSSLPKDEPFTTRSLRSTFLTYLRTFVQTDATIATAWAKAAIGEILPQAALQSFEFENNIDSADDIRHKKNRRLVKTNSKSNESLVKLRDLIYVCYEVYPEEVLAAVNDWCVKTFPTWSAADQTMIPCDSNHDADDPADEMSEADGDDDDGDSTKSNRDCFSAQDALCLFHLAMLASQTLPDRILTNHQRHSDRGLSSPLSSSQTSSPITSTCAACGTNLVVTSSIFSGEAHKSTSSPSQSFCCCILCNYFTSLPCEFDSVVITYMKAIHGNPKTSENQIKDLEIQELEAEIEFIATFHPVLWIRYLPLFQFELSRSLQPSNFNTNTPKMNVSDAGLFRNKSEIYDFVKNTTQTPVSAIYENAQQHSQQQQQRGDRISAGFGCNVYFNITGYDTNKPNHIILVVKCLKQIPVFLLVHKSCESFGMSNLTNFLRNFERVRKVLSRSSTLSLKGDQNDLIQMHMRGFSEWLAAEAVRGSEELQYYQTILLPSCRQEIFGFI